MIHCKHCEALNADELSFCSQCGTPLHVHSPATQPSPYGYPPRYGQPQHQPQYGQPQQGHYQQPPYQQPYYQQPPQQQPYDINVSTQASPHPNYAVVQRSHKNVVLAMVLGLLFGPLGMLYSTVSGAMIMLLVSFFVAAIAYGLAIPFLWPVCMVWAGIAADKRNKGK